MNDDNVLKSIKVMIIDDSNTIRKSAEMFLRSSGYEVILAEDGFEAMSKILSKVTEWKCPTFGWVSSLYAH